MSIVNPDLEKFGTNNFIYAYEMVHLKKSDRITVKRCI